MLKKVFNVITTVIVAAVVVLAVLLVGVRVFGFRPFAILSPSMSPKYLTGDLVYVKKAAFEDIKVGDVITCVIDDSSKTVTHRVVKIDSEERTFETKGDANADSDGAPRLYENVVGVVKFSIPKLGYLSIFLNTTSGKLAAIAAAALAVLLILLPDLLKLSKKGKDKPDASNNA